MCGSVQVLRICVRFIKSDDVLLDVFVVEKSRVTTLQDLEAMAHFEAQCAQQESLGPKRSNVMIHRLHEATFIERVVECCRTFSPQLIVLGSSEGPEGIVPELPREKRASVLHGAETCFRKMQLLGKLGKALAGSEIEASLLVVLCPGARGVQKAGLEPLGMLIENDEACEELKSQVSS